MVPSSHEHQSRCNTHFRGQVAGCQVFLVPFDLNEVAKRLYARWQWFMLFLFSLFLGVFDANSPLCNTQQGYSPPGGGNCRQSASVS